MTSYPRPKHTCFNDCALQRHLGSLSPASLAYFHNIPLALRANIPDIIAHRSRNLVEVFCANLCSMNLGGAIQRHLGSLSPASLAYFHNIPLALRANIPDIIAHRSRNLVEVFRANLCSMNLGGAVA